MKDELSLERREDDILLTTKGKPEHVKLPKYGEVKFIVKNGKIVDSEITTKYKHR